MKLYNLQVIPKYFIFCCPFQKSVFTSFYKTGSFKNKTLFFQNPPHNIQVIPLYIGQRRFESRDGTNGKTLLDLIFHRQYRGLFLVIFIQFA